jgi:hypothetical protein
VQVVVKEAGGLRLVVALDGLRSEAVLRAHLFVGRAIYHAAARGRELRFEGVALGEEVERAGLFIETL